MKKLQNKTTLITGCNRGIGKAIVEKFASEGANIICAIRKEHSEFKAYTDELSAKYNVSIEHVYFDLADEESIRSAMRELSKEKRVIDVLVKRNSLKIINLNYV